MNAHKASSARYSLYVVSPALTVAKIILKYIFLILRAINQTLILMNRFFIIKK